MRLPESKIKEAILHPDADIRERVVRYFDKSFSQDTSVVPLVIQAVERYGRDGAYHLIGSCTELAHTDETISWVVEELNREDADCYGNYAYNLMRVLCDADPRLLVHRDTQIIEARHFLASYHDTFLERLEMLSWDEATCWRELEANGTGVLEDIHADLSVEKCLAFLPQEEDLTIKSYLAHASLSQFAYEAIEPVRQLLLAQPHKGEWRHLRNDLVQTCAIMEERFPEYEECCMKKQGGSPLD